MLAQLFNFIVWNASPEIFSLGLFSLRWYGLLFATGFLVGQQILIRIYKGEGKTEKHVETLTVYMVLATIIGARLGHCLFYQPEIYLKNPLEILYIWEGGLASHGAAAGILIAIYIYSRKQTDQSYLYVLDRMVITIALAGCLIRLGNLMNSEIYGKQTDASIGFVYVRGAQTEIGERFSSFVSDVKISDKHNDTILAGRKYRLLDLSFRSLDKYNERQFLENFSRSEIEDHLHYGQHPDLRENILVPEGNLPFSIDESKGHFEGHFQIIGIPRHPTQIYEALLALLLFVFLLYEYKRYKEKLPEGRIFGLFVVILFTFRVFVEYLKAPQVEFENQLFLNMGQLLSIPLIIAGLFVLIRSYRTKDAIS